LRAIALAIAGKRSRHARLSSIIEPVAMPESAFFLPLPDGRFRATPATVGPWDPRLQHGSPPAALLARAVERATPRDDVRIGRIAFDFFGAVPAGELAVDAEVVRPGARIDLSRARITAGDRTLMEARAWRISAAPGRVTEVPFLERPPALPGPQAQVYFADTPPFGYGEALEWRFVEGGMDRLGPATVYARPRIPLVEGEAASDLGRLLLMVDSANGVSAELPLSKFTFVPVELTVTVTRHPRTEWVGMRAKTTIDPDGVGLARADLFDEAGFLGLAVQTLFVAPRK
jgi:hypothetical protein